MSLDAVGVVVVVGRPEPQVKSKVGSSRLTVGEVTAEMKHVLVPAVSDAGRLVPVMATVKVPTVTVCTPDWVPPKVLTEDAPPEVVETWKVLVVNPVART